MKKIILFAIVFLLLVNPALALNLDVEESKDSQDVLVVGVERPAKLNLSITNNGERETFRLSNLFGFHITPVGNFEISPGNTKKIEMEIYPRADESPGIYNFKYSIISGGSKQKFNSLIEIVELKDAINIETDNFNFKENTAKVKIKNNKNFDFGEMNIKISSEFFNLEKQFELSPNETKEFKVDLNEKKVDKLLAGVYNLNANIQIGNKTFEILGEVEFSENKDIQTTKEEYGWIVNTDKIIKKNEGNVVETFREDIERNIISRLFTTMNPEPTLTKREGTKIYYAWSEILQPGEKFEITVKTNWFYPIIILILIGIIIVFIKKYSVKDLELKKKVSFVKTKGGEFALKISIIVKAKNYLEDISITDRVPSMLKLHERFGVEKPTKVGKHKKKLVWNFDHLDTGESRVLTYLAYSKLGFLGKFVLPPTVGIYKKEGNTEESQSNRAYFVSEQSKPKKEE